MMMVRIKGKVMTPNNNRAPLGKECPLYEKNEGAECSSAGLIISWKSFLVHP